MKRDTGWITASILGITTIFGISSRHSAVPEGHPTVDQKATQESHHPEPPKHSSVSGTGRNATPATISDEAKLEEAKKPIANLFNSFLSATSTTATTPPADYTPPQNPTPNFRVIIATLPDPVHTNLSLMFDQDIEAIQQGAQDAGYTYDTSWFPWETHSSTYDSLEDSDKAEERTRLRQLQPGVLLFRKALHNGLPTNPYIEGLAIFVVGEQATRGVNQAQFDSAIQWANRIAKANSGPPHQLQILGPTFSGSFPSLAEVVDKAKPGLLPQAKPEEPLEIFSGQTSSNTAVVWFAEHLKSSKGSVRFLSFVQDDMTVIRRFANYLKQANIDTKRVFLVSEDETSYGDFKDDVPFGQTQVETSEGPVKLSTLYYPRDISAVRAAYQEQSLFSKYSTAQTSEPQHTLRSNLTDSEGKQNDTVRTFSGNQLALSQEAVLLQTVNLLKEHQAQFILLRSTNPLDQLFLAHFFKMTYPEGRIVILGSDLLLRREVTSGGLTGVFTLSTYPSLPSIDDWTAPDPQVTGAENLTHFHRAFTHDGAQGTYVALRALLRKQGDTQISTELFTPGYSSSTNLPTGYSQPFWMRAPNEPYYPLSWLSVLGTNGFSPVAVLDAISGKADPGSEGKYSSPSSRRQDWRAPPLSLKFALLANFLWALLHAFCCCSPSLTVKPERRSYFAWMENRFPVWSRHSHTALLIISASFVVMVAIVLSWSYGWMAGKDAPIFPSVICSLFPWIIWIITSVGLIVNALIENPLPEISDNNPASPNDKKTVVMSAWIRALAKALTPLFAFLLITVSFYFFYSVVIDDRLLRGVRTLTYLRAMNLTSGTSPTPPLLLLTLGLYGWAWCSLRGLAFFGPDRPRLPQPLNLRFPTNDVNGKQYFLMLSKDKGEDPIERNTDPFDPTVWGIVAAVFLVLWLATCFLSEGAPLRSLGLQRYSNLVAFWIAFNISLLIGCAWQFMHLWRQLRGILMFLDKLPLRRTMQAMHGFTWGSIWKMGGNVLDVRYQLFYRFFESLNHFGQSLQVKPTQAGQAITSLSEGCSDLIAKTKSDREAFAEWYATHWDDWKARDLTTLAKVQEDAAEIAGTILTSLLLPEWQNEEQSLLIPKTAEKEEAGGAPSTQESPLSYVRNGEEVVCIVYLGFIQNILGRIRTLVIAMVWLFLSVALILPSYPFDPRPLFSGVVLTLFIIVGVVVSLVYAQMFRDATLSHLTDTKPGELGSEFWIKIISFAAGPAFGLLATTLPGLSDTLFSWLQPSLSSLK